MDWRRVGFRRSGGKNAFKRPVQCGGVCCDVETGHLAPGQMHDMGAARRCAHPVRCAVGLAPFDDRKRVPRWSADIDALKMEMDVGQQLADDRRR